MKLFGRRAGRVEARPVISRVAGSGAAWPSSYEAQVREGYLGNAVAQRAVRLVAEAVGSAPVVASDPALAALVAARSGGQGLIETVAAQMLLHGNAFVQVIADSEGVRELFALRPERVPALAEDRERLWAAVSAADFLDRDEKRAMLGVGSVLRDASSAPLSRSSG